MSNEKPTYINGIFVTEYNKNPEFPPIFNVAIQLQKFTDELARHADENGKVRVKIKKRREPGKYGDTHFVVLDTWKPSREADETP